MSAFRIIPLAAALIALATAAAAQTSAAKDEPTPGTEPIQPVMDRPILAHVIFNQLEGRWNGTDTQFRWDGQGWAGTDYDKLWIKSEGTLQSTGTLDDGQQQFLYDRAITTYFDLRGGLRSDIDSRPTRNWAAFGIQGLAPYFFDLELTGYLSGEGHFAAKLEGSYDLLLTQRLILQPRRGTLGDRGIPPEAAGHERAGLRQTRDGEHRPWRPPSFRQCRSRFSALGRCRHSPTETMIQVCGQGALLARRR